MADALSTAATQGPSPRAGVQATVQATTTSNPTPASSPQVATSPLAKASTPATQLDMSAASGMSNEEPPAAPMTMEQAAQAYQNYLTNLPSDLVFQPDYQAGLMVFKVVNPVTNQVIRQLPPEAVVEQARNLRLANGQSNSGIILDDSL